LRPVTQIQISLVVNGERQAFDGPLSVESLLRQVSLKVPRVAVLVNGEVVRREDHAHAELRDGDAVELISMVGGG
jgi:thiamine biosynthesis protein ThiS